MESLQSPHGLHEDSWRVLMESSWSLWERVGECKVLEIPSSKAAVIASDKGVASEAEEVEDQTESEDSNDSIEEPSSLIHTKEKEVVYVNKKAKKQGRSSLLPFLKLSIEKRVLWVRG